MQKQPRLLDQVRDRIRYKHYSIRTEKSYLDWIRRFICFHGKKHPVEMGSAEIETFLTHLAVQGNVSASTQNQALSAILFLYREVLAVDLPWLSDFRRAKESQKLPVVLNEDEVKSVLVYLDGIKWLMASLLYGSGMRLMECIRPGVKEFDFTQLSGSNKPDNFVAIKPDKILTRNMPKQIGITPCSDSISTLRRFRVNC